MNRRTELSLHLPLYALLAALFSLTFVATSPWIEGHASDQSVFSIVGQRWSMGLLPYLDSWDNKGPLIFFVNRIGHQLMEGERGILVLQGIQLWLLFGVVHHFLRRHCSLPWLWTCQLLFFMSYATICSGGNQVADSHLLLTFLSVFFLHQWAERADTNRWFMPWWQATLHGALLSACLLSRLTDALPVVFFLLGIALLWIRQRQWRSLLQGSLFLLLGSLCVFLPFALYFAAHRALGEMWYATFTYNVEYALQAAARQQPLTLTTPLYWTVYHLCLIAPLVAGLLSFRLSGHRRRAFLLTLSALPTLLWAWRNPQASYAISFLPFLLVGLVELPPLAHRRAARWSLLLIILGVVGGFFNHLRVKGDYYVIAPHVAVGREMMKQVPRTESFVAYNVDPDFYITDHRQPCYRFFTLQDWAISNGASLRPLVQDCFRKGNAQWILVKDAEQSAIRSTLEQRYEVVKQHASSCLTLYRLKK